MQKFKDCIACYMCIQKSTKETTVDFVQKFALTKITHYNYGTFQLTNHPGLTPVHFCQSKLNQQCSCEWLGKNNSQLLIKAFTN